MNEIMLDIETMGTSQNAAIVSIGAVEFSFDEPQLGRGFYIKIDVQDCLKHGLVVDWSTIQWWLQQNEKARLELTTTNRCKLQEALFEFTKFMTPLLGDSKKFNVWGNPSSFDIGILSNAYSKCGLESPIFYRNERDLRTLVSLAPEIKANYPNQGTEHNPIDDCKYQIGYAKATYDKIMKKI